MLKKVDRLVLNAFLRPFLSTFSIVLFLLLMLFLFKYIDDLVGKGFEWYVILKLLFYASASQVAVALPLAVLLSSLMTVGELGEKFELVAFKAGGVSLQRILRPLMVASLFLSVVAFLFSNYVLPIANLKMGSLLYDVRQQKPAFLIKEGVFYSGIEGYTIRADRKSRDEQHLYGVMIYDHSRGQGNTSVLLAESGEMLKAPDGSYLTLSLHNGVSYEEQSPENAKYYDPRRQFTRIKFKEHEVKFDLSGFQLNRTDESLFKNNYLMLNVSQLTHYSDSLTSELHKRDEGYFKYAATYYRYFEKQTAHSTFQQKLAFPVTKQSINGALTSARSIKSYYESENDARNGFLRSLYRYQIEYHLRFTLSIACFVFFLMGAPLGAIVKKGGLGMPVVIAVGLFIVNHILTNTCMNYCRDGSMPVIAMWLATAFFIPVGVFLLYKSATDSRIMDMETYQKAIKKLVKGIKKA